MKINSIIDLVKDLDTSRQTKNLNKLLIRILLHLQVEFSLYNYLHNADYWTPEHTNSKYASPAYNNFDGHSYYKDFTYIQIKNITLGYNFEKNFVKKLGLSGLGVNISVENPYTFCDIRSVLNYDNSWFASYPTARSYVLGLNLSF